MFPTNLLSQPPHDNSTVALLALLDAIGGDAVAGHYFPAGWFTAVRIKTWRDLERKELITKFPLSGEGVHYGLTGRGWLEALKAAGRTRTPEFDDNVRRYISAGKAHLNHNAEARVALEDLAAQAGLPWTWISNAIEGKLLSAAFGWKDAAWARRNSIVLIPADFGT